MSDVIMPQMGESIVEGTVTKWFKKVGDRVERDEPLFEISTDKVDTEIPAPAGGVLTEILVTEGQTVQVNTVVARIGEGDGRTATAPQPAAATPPPPAPALTPAKGVPPPASIPPPQPVPVASEAPAAAEQDIRSSPLVRRLAKEHSIDLRLVKGTGQGGRISKQDIEDYLARQTAQPPAARPEQPPAAPGSAPPSAAFPPGAFPPAPAALFGRYTVEKLSVMRQRIAEHMVLTKQVSPHVSTVQQVDATRVARLRESVKGQFQQQNGVKLTFLPFFLRAASAALKAFPIANASLHGLNLIYHQDINIGIAVAVDWGLIVPVIKNADEKNFLGLQRAVNDLAERSRRKQLKPDEVQGGTFSITNYGSFGSLFATPAINQPQAAILGLGAIHKAPVVIEDAIAIRSIVYVTLSFDHRILDGAIADQFLGHLKQTIENWGEEIL